MGKYRTLVVDPPWDSSRGKAIFTGMEYPPFRVLSNEELLEFPINEFAAEESHLYLWATNAFLRFAFDLLDAWHFKFHCVLVWNKNNGFRPAVFSFRNEFVLFAYRGKLKVKEQPISVSTSFSAKCQGWAKKPNELYKIAEKVSLSPRIDIFSREGREGWDIWGDEASQGGREAIQGRRGVLGLPIWREIR